MDIRYSYKMYRPENFLVTLNSDQGQVPCEKPQKKEETTMRTETENQRSYLDARLSVIRNDMENALKKHFGLMNDEAPETSKDLVKRIQDGKFVLPKDREDCYAGDAHWSIIWRDPAVKEDQEGYDAAYAKLRAAYKVARDDINILPPEEGLKTLRAFEATTFH